MMQVQRQPDAVSGCVYDVCAGTGGVLCDDMGLGKTVQVCLIWDLKHGLETYRRALLASNSGWHPAVLLASSSTSRTQDGIQQY